MLDFGLAKAIRGTGGAAGSLADGDRRPRRDRGGAYCGYSRVHESGAGARRGGGPADGHLGLRMPLVRVARRKARFESETVSDTIAAVLEHEPDWQALPTKTPAKVRDLLRQCLQKDANRRLDDIRMTLAGSTERSNRRPPRPAARASGRRARSGATTRDRLWPPHRRPAWGGGRHPRARGAAALQPHARPRTGVLRRWHDRGADRDSSEIHRYSRVISRTSAMHYKATTKTLKRSPASWASMASSRAR